MSGRPTDYTEEMSSQAIEIIGRQGIYALLDPIDDSIRYVGQSVDLARRQREHLAAFRKKVKDNTWYARWINSLQAEPIFKVLELTDDLDSREEWWINYLRKKGHRITNTAPGGGKYPDTPIDKLARLMRTRFGKESTPYQYAKAMADASRIFPDYGIRINKKAEELL